MATKKAEYEMAWLSIAENLSPLPAVDQLVLSNVCLKTVNYVTELEKEVERLKEFEWKYLDLCR